MPAATLPMRRESKVLAVALWSLFSLSETLAFPPSWLLTWSACGLAVLLSIAMAAFIVPRFAQRDRFLIGWGAIAVFLATSITTAFNLLLLMHLGPWVFSNQTGVPGFAIPATQGELYAQSRVIFSWNLIVYLTYTSVLLFFVARQRALTAQLLAWRYQLDPHFLFNVLNSVEGLIEENRNGRAIRMVQSLANFLRITLTLDPTQQIRLADEIALQREYLDIEQVRFGDRMSIRVAIDTAAENCMVPSLILQPLVENAVKHGVAAVPGQVEVVLTAEQVADRLVICVENDRPASDPVDRKGMGVGIPNVFERLQSCFGRDFRFDLRRPRDDKFRAMIDVPARLSTHPSNE